MNKQMQTILAIVLVATTVVLRIASNQSFLANFTPILAMGLFAGSVFTNKKLAVLLPIVAMLLSDIYFQLFTNIQGFYGISQIFNYAAFGLVALLGTKLQSQKLMNILGFAIGGSVLFFIISNFGTWADPACTMYVKNISGLMNCFVNGIPFYKNSFISDVLFSTIFFGLYYLASLKTAKVFSKA
jgi:hypothetical protein